MHQVFVYSLGGLRPELGDRVLVPFGNGERIGLVVGFATKTRLAKVKPILGVLDSKPVVTSTQMELAFWMSSYYATPLGIILKAMLPSFLTRIPKEMITLVDRSPVDLDSRKGKIVQFLQDRGGTSTDFLKRQLGLGPIRRDLRSLVTEGVVDIKVQPPEIAPVKTEKIVTINKWFENLGELESLLGRAKRQLEAYKILADSGGKIELAHLVKQAGFSRGVISGLENKGVVQVEDRVVQRDPFSDIPVPNKMEHAPTGDQAKAIEAILESYEKDKGTSTLLHGVTGSGKTLVYVEVIKKILELGRGAIVLVPEISLTPQTVSRFRARFGNQVAVLHSALSEGERFDAWEQLKSGERMVAVGARSAVFAPIKNLGIIVVDEEHDSTYKQNEAPRYQARDVATVRAVKEGAVCILGSATPSLESWYNKERKKFHYISLPERVGGGSLPPVQTVDLRKELKDRKSELVPGRDVSLVLTTALKEAIGDRVSKGEQTLLLLNRRGYSSFIQCRTCGGVETCTKCSISMTFHRSRGQMVCHHCGTSKKAAVKCSSCDSSDLSFKGMGTEQVERIVTETFPSARLVRMDVDTTSGKWSHQEILGRVERGEVDILLGTQMISKGLDFPRVTLVGVINADVGMHLPDFRSSERTFQLLSQVAGRTGRGSLGGEVFIQTFLPEHYVLQATLDHDYLGFVQRELSQRRNPSYPPYVRLVNVVVSSPDKECAADNVEAASRFVTRVTRGMSKGGEVDMVGPAPCPIEKIQDRWRWHFLLRSASISALNHLVEEVSRNFKTKGRDVRLILDRDPSSLL